MTLVRSIVAVLTAIGLMTGAAGAQSYPDRLVKIIVPQGPGGPTDLLARVAAQRLQTAYGQNVIIENRGGAGGVIAAKAAGSAEGDGYTLFMGNTSVLVLIPILSKTASYDPARLFTPVARLAESYQVLVVHPSLPVKTVAELVAYAKTNPSKLNYSSAGIGNTIHLAGELFNHSAGVNIVHVPYNSGAEATTAVLGGQVQMTFVNITGLPPLIADGKLRALAVTSPKRQALLPGRADHDRERLSGLRRARVLRHRGAGRHAGCDR
jgi:tripartite-type tricarboxylate transporter receptor subunit TctC